MILSLPANLEIKFKWRLLEAVSCQSLSKTVQHGKARRGKSITLPPKKSTFVKASRVNF